jgi:hypothetical protein
MADNLRTKVVQIGFQLKYHIRLVSLRQHLEGKAGQRGYSTSPRTALSTFGREARWRVPTPYPTLRVRIVGMAPNCWPNSATIAAPVGVMSSWVSSP